MRVGDLVDDLLGLLGGLATLGGDVDGAVVLDGDLGAGVLLDLVDHLALRADDLADLVHRNGGGDDARRVRAHLGRAVDALVDDLEDGGAGLLGLLQGGGQDVGGDAVELGVQLQGGDELGGAGHLEVHVAERVLGAQDVGQGLEDVLAVHVAGDQAHRDAGDRGLQRHTGGEQAQGRGAHGAHRGRTVGADGLGDLTDGVRELLAARQHRHDRLLGKGAVADLAALRGADAAGLAGGVRRHLVVVHVALGLRAGQRIELLLHLEHVQRGDAQDLGLTALEQGGAVHARDDVDLGGQRADVTQAAAVDAVVLGQDAAAHDLALQLLERVAELLLLLGLVHVGELVRQHILDMLLDLGDTVLTRQLLRNGQRLIQIGVSDLVDAGVQLVGVLREELELLGLLGGDALELGLSLADDLDERLGGLQATGHNLLVRLDLALVVDQGPRVLAGAGLDHRDRDVAIVHHAAGDHDLEHGALTLAPTRERNPLAIDQRQTDAGDRALERQTGDHRGGGGGVQRDDVVRVIRVDGQDRLHNLHLVAQRVREQRAQRAVDDTAGQDRLGARAAFTAEERARDLAGGVHLLFNVHGQREEVVVLLRAGTGGGGGQHHRIIIQIRGHGAVGLLGEAAGLEAQRALAKRTIVDYGLNGLDFGTLQGFLLCVLIPTCFLVLAFTCACRARHTWPRVPRVRFPHHPCPFRASVAVHPSSESRHAKRPSTRARAEEFNYRRRPSRSISER